MIFFLTDTDFQLIDHGISANLLNRTLVTPLNEAIQLKYHTGTYMVSVGDTENA